MELKANKISKWFLRNRGETNRFFALNETDFTLKEGELLVIYGSSGSGKSTLINVISGLLTPSSGNVTVGETDIFNLDDLSISKFRNENFGIVPQGQTAINSLTVLENVLLPYTLYHTQEDDKFTAVRERAEIFLEKMGILELANVMPTELSGGELRRMAVSRALINNPSIIIADEPTSDLDDENSSVVLSIFRELADSGKSVLIITHDKEVFSYADKIFKMKNGSLFSE